MSYSSPGVAGVGGDQMRNIYGAFVGYDLDANSQETWTGPFYQIDNVVNSGPVSANRYGETTTVFSAARVVPTGPAFAPRRWGALACVYLGRPEGS